MTSGTVDVFGTAAGGRDAIEVLVEVVPDTEYPQAMAVGGVPLLLPIALRGGLRQSGTARIVVIADVAREVVGTVPSEMIMSGLDGHTRDRNVNACRLGAGPAECSGLSNLVGAVQLDVALQVGPVGSDGPCMASVAVVCGCVGPPATVQI